MITSLQLAIKTILSILKSRQALVLENLALRQGVVAQLASEAGGRYNGS